MKKRKGWYDRTEQPRVTADWVKLNCRSITDREMEILRIVHKRKYVRRDHLEWIHPDFRVIENQGSRVTVLNRSITKLFEKMCLDKVHEQTGYKEGNKPCIIALDKAGAILLKTPFYRRIKQRKTFKDGQLHVHSREVPIQFLHVNGINQLEVDTIKFCIENNWKLVRWDIENTRKFSSGAEKIRLTPDVFAIFGFGNKPIISFLEYDTGTEDKGNSKKFPMIDDKLNKYKKFLQSGQWMKEGWYKRLKGAGFPLLIFVTEDKKRVEFVEKRGKELGLQLEVVLSQDYNSLLNKLKANL